jgi:ATP-dependent exoDNAse (exonuclease V) beta subunit
VGITRAQEFLIISFEANKELKIQNGSFIWMLQKGLDIDFEMNMLSANGTLTFLMHKDDQYLNKEKLLSLNIPIIKDIQLVNPVINPVSVVNKKYAKINTIEDHISGEIISATRFSVFNQCPMKYYMRFGVGLNLLNEEYPHLNTDGAENHKDVDGTLKGKIIHSLLEMNITKEELSKRASIFVEKEKISPREKKALIKEIVKDLDKYLSSDKYKQISSLHNFRNEFEIYLQMDEFYLYGRIDKVIFTEDKIKIIDYKTDNISPDFIKSRTAQYLSQVKFYSYILSRLNENINKYELQIVFIKNPDAAIYFEINKNDFPLIESEIKKMIDSLKSGNYFTKTEHCRDCIYSVIRTLTM